MIGYQASHEQFAPLDLLRYVRQAEAAGFLSLNSLLVLWNDRLLDPDGLARRIPNSPFAEAVMRDEPFFATAIAEQLGAGHPEHAPALEPQGRVLAVGFPQHRHDRTALTVLPDQPLIGGPLVVPAVYQPASLDGQRTLEVQ